MAMKSFSAVSLLVAMGFFGGTHFVEGDLLQSYFLGAFSTGLVGAIALISYTKLVQVRATRADAGASLESWARAPEAERASSRERSWVDGFLDLVERPAESTVLNGLAFVCVLVAIGFLAGTHVVESEIGQSFCLGAFSTGLVGSMLLLGYTKFVRVAESRRIEQILRESRERLDILVENATDVITILGADGTIRFETPSVRQMLGYEPDSHVGLPLTARVHPDDVGALTAALEQVLADPGAVVVTRERQRHRDGGWQITESYRKCITVADRPEIVSNTRDITERTQMVEALRESRRRFQDFAETAADFFWETDARLRYTYLSERFEEKTGMSQGAVLGRRPDEVFAEQLEAAEDPSRYERHFRAHEPYTEHELRLLHPSGGLKVFRESGKPLFDDAGEFIGFRGATRDVTDAHRLSEELSYQANHDMLTGLINRRCFDERLQRVIDRQDSESGGEHVLCYLDLDQFKVVNDTCGHLAGDVLLRQLGALLKRRVRGRDTLARLGGDEFAVLMEHCALDQGARVADSIRQAVDDYRFKWEHATFKIGVSIGVVAIDGSHDRAAEVLSAADAACYIAKERGRNRMHVLHLDDAHLARRHGEMQWVSRINNALDDGRLRLSYQPIVSLRADAPEPAGEHFELLLRLVDERGEIVLPDQFLPAAERYGLSGRIDQWVVRTITEWFASHPEQLEQLELCSINLSGHSVADDAFPDFLVEQIEAAGVPAEKLCFEITETAAIANMGTASRLMDRMRSMGCRFALDDFGSGVSSFAYLRALPVDFLKIDGMFVKKIVDSDADLAVLKSINEVGQTLGKKTIAEYADSVTTLEALRAIGVDYAQGHALAEPRALAELETAQT